MPASRGQAAGVKRNLDDSDDDYVERPAAKKAKGKGAKIPEEGRLQPRRGKEAKNGDDRDKGRAQPRPKHVQTEGSPSGTAQPDEETKKTRKPRLPDAAKVPFTTVARYEPTDNSDSRLAHEEAHRTKKMIEEAPVFWCEFDLDALQERKKNTVAERERMQEIVDEMEDRPGRATSCIVVDRRGRIIIAYFSQRARPEKVDDKCEKEDRPAPRKRKHRRKAEEAQEALTTEQVLAQRAHFFLAKAQPISKFYEESIPDRDAEVWNDGIPRDISKRAHQATQDFAALSQPRFADRDIRHVVPDDKTSETSASDPRLVYLPLSHIQPRQLPSKGTRNDTQRRVSATKTSSAFQEDGLAPERCGVYHLVHAWHAQGTKVNDRIGPSTDLTGTGGKMSISQHYYENTSQLAVVVRERFRGLFPDYFERYTKAFQAGCRFPGDPGPFIGRALVWKLQVRAHLDGLEAGPVASTPEGAFSDGGMVFPDFKELGEPLKFRYAPGDLCFCYAGALYHGVAKWKALPVTDKDAADSISPGRLSTVFFFPQQSLETLEDKPPRWAIVTSGGLLASASR